MLHLPGALVHGGWAVRAVGRRAAAPEHRPLPFKHHAARRQRIPRAQYRVRNWPAYDAGLRRRGDLTLWLDEAAIAGWRAAPRTTPGGQARYSDLAIELVLTLRLVFQLALRQAEGFVGSVLRLLELRVPDHRSGRRRSMAGPAGSWRKLVWGSPCQAFIAGTPVRCVALRSAAER